MKKRFLSALLTALVIALCVIQCFASPELLVDNADLLTDDEEARLTAILDEISARRSFDLAVVTTPSFEGKDAFYWASDFYEANGYGQGASYDGAMFVIGMAERECYIIGTGRGEYALNDSVVDFILDCVIDDLRGGDYLGAFTTYAQMADSYLDEDTGSSGDYIYDDGGMIYGGDGYYPEYQRRFNVGKSVAISLVIGFVIALIAVSIMKGKMKSVHSKASAADYTRRGSMRLQRSNDIFLYRNVNRVRRQQPTQTRSGGGGHISMSGRSYSGGGRKF